MHQRLFQGHFPASSEPDRTPFHRRTLLDGMNTFHGVSAIVCLWCCLSSSGTEMPSAPTTYYVATDSAVLRAGPGRHFYATNQIPQNTRLECYQITTDNWVATRPVNSSFSLVARKDVLITDNSRVGQTASANAKAWIGSRLTEAINLRSVVQLKKGERLAIRGVRSVVLHQGGKSETMYEIAPPNGEFRWIHKSDLRSRHASGLQQAQYVRQSSSIGDSFVARTTYHRERPHHQPRSNQLDHPSWPSKTSPSVVPVSGQDKIDALVIQLTSTIAHPLEQWTFDTLQNEATKLAKTGKSIVIRARAHKLLKRIDSFSSLQQGLDSNPLHVQRKRNGTWSTNEHPQTPVGTGVRQTAFNPVAEEQYGWLLPTVSRVDAPRRIPPFVLKDDLGKITAFVTPSPGLNLYRYKKQRVRIRGKQEFLHHSQMPHVTATRVIQSSHSQH